MRLCKGQTPNVERGRSKLLTRKQPCGALAEEGIDYCAAHAKLAGLLHCPAHGWVTPLYRHGTVVDGSIVFACPRRDEHGPAGWCATGWDSRRQRVALPEPVFVPIGQEGD